MNRGELFAARYKNEILGFVRFRHRRDGLTTLYEIAVVHNKQGNRIGKKLVDALVDDCRRVGIRRIRLSCPAELPANGFYKRLGFVHTEGRSKAGVNRPLYEWHLTILPKRILTFVASITASSRDIGCLIKIWETEGVGKPFEKCIVTPLFIEAKSFEYVKYMQRSWGVKVIFDSGGFFVQQGKIAYDELFARLLKFYLQNDWGNIFVLPDYVPTSKNTAQEVQERVLVTAAEGIKFFKRLPLELRSRAMGVLQGRTPEHLRHCLDAFLGSGVQHLGFGSFDTGGAQSEINLMTNDAARRLDFVRDMLQEKFVKYQIEDLPSFHLFGVSAPNVVEKFRAYLATSFDSSGWMRTAGYGNIYLPFKGRRNVTHGSSSLLNGPGLSASEFYAQCEHTKHQCPFCKDFKRLQQNRFARMLHNTMVFQEMVAAINEEKI